MIHLRLMFVPVFLFILFRSFIMHKTGCEDEEKVRKFVTKKQVEAVSSDG
jgi:hypothetical protein